MRFTTILAANIGAAVGFVAARQLLAPGADLERLPEGMRGPVVAARSRLLRARARFAVGLNEGAAERDEAERELRREYGERTAPKR